MGAEATWHHLHDYPLRAYDHDEWCIFRQQRRDDGWTWNPVGIHRVRRFLHLDRYGGVLAVLLRAGVHTPRKDDVSGGICHTVRAQQHLRPNRITFRARTVQFAHGLRAPNADDGTPVCVHQVCFRH